jgi:hypothetical protein
VIYPKNNLFVVSNNPQSLGLMNNMTTVCGPGTTTTLMNGIATMKSYLASGALTNSSKPLFQCGVTRKSTSVYQC